MRPRVAIPGSRRESSANEYAFEGGKTDSIVKMEIQVGRSSIFKFSLWVSFSWLSRLVKRCTILITYIESIKCCIIQFLENFHLNWAQVSQLLIQLSSRAGCGAQNRVYPRIPRKTEIYALKLVNTKIKKKNFSIIKLFILTYQKIY